jgi:transglutaminase-like putative cysteine protease
MFGKARDNLQRLTAPREIEESLPFRIAVWAAVCISVYSLAPQMVSSTAVVTAALILITLGSYISWRRRHKRNIALKVVIALLTLAALASFLRQVYLNPYDPRLPLAELFVWVLVLHSFDLPRRRDLVLSLVSSLILLSLAGSFALNASFAWLILVWLAAALPSLYFAQASRLQSLSAIPDRSDLSRPSPRKLALVLVVLVVTICCLGLAFGAFMPRVSATFLRTLPFSLRRSFNPSEGFQFTNPGYPGLPFRPPESALEVNPEAYFGFSPFLDLRARGRLVDLPVMKVRATEPAYWRGMSFRDYNGYSWLAAEEEPELLHASEQPFRIRHGDKSVHLSSRRNVQTFYIEGEEPNIIFAAYRPSLVYFPSDYIYQDSSGLKSPFALSEGLVYSVVSDTIVLEELMSIVNIEAVGDHMKPYLEVPQLPQRVLDLAEEIVPEDAGPYDRALAIEHFLENEYKYSLDIPPLPPGEDALDFFLFEQRQGYCEHFATAHAILCRLAGVPARVVTGYSTGDYNPFTGLYEVSLSDAHAWVEIYLQGIGWVTMEPTPGFVMPESGGASGSMWIFGDFMSWVGSRISSLIPGSVRSALKSGLSTIASAASSLISGIAYSIRHAPWLPVIFLLILLLFILFYLAGKRTPRRPRSDKELDGAVAIMRDFLEAADSLGYSRDPSQTAGEYLDELSMSVPGLALSGEIRLFERARYGGRALLEEELSRLREGLNEALSLIRRHLRIHGGAASA